MSIPVAQLCWMAGVIDIKGRLVKKVNKQRVTPQYVLTVRTKEFPVIQKLSGLTGTAPEIQKAREAPDWWRRGCVEHCPEPHIHQQYPGGLPEAATWTVTGAAMATVLWNVLPFLAIDREYSPALKEVLESTVSDGRGSVAVRSSLKRLKDLGWDLPPRFEEFMAEQP